MKRMLTTLSISCTVASLMLALAPSHIAVAAAAAATPKPAATARKAPAGDACAGAKSKWGHFECEQFHGSAPGDEYFGRMKLSYLGIDNTYKDGAVSAGAYSTDAALIGRLDFATEALRRWAAKYPNDPQLPRSYFLGIEVLRKIYTQPEQQMAWHFMQLLVTKYHTSYFGKVMKASVARGFTEHWFALAQICPTPLPPGVMPETTPNATPVPSPAPGRPAVDIITPACVEPSPVPEPEYSPMPESSATPLPGPSLSPTAAPTPRPRVRRS